MFQFGSCKSCELQTTSASVMSLADKFTSLQHPMDPSKKKRRYSIKEARQHFEDFDKLALLGRGSFGVVLLAKFKTVQHYNSLLAIKCIRKDITLAKDSVADAHAEKECLMLENPYIASAVCTFQDLGYLYYAMEFQAGGDLINLLQSTDLGRLELSVASTLSLEVLMGLRFLHSKKILYRDLKLENVLIGKDGHIRIADFGFSKTNIKDFTSTFLGTSDYMAPEIVKKQPYEFKIDVWAWGICFYVMLEGAFPFFGDDDDEIYQQITDKEIDWESRNAISETDPVVHVLQSALRKDPRNRHTADQLINSSFYTGLNLLEYAMGKHKPVLQKTKVRNFNDKEDLNEILGRFDEMKEEEKFTVEEMTSEEGFKELSRAEDKIFGTFSWKNPAKFDLYKS